jgi:hypothetical protein
MSTTETTDAIDEKKSEETTTKLPNTSSFIANYLSSIIFTIGFSVFLIGSLGLYTTKVAQANILPDNIELAPYTIFDRIVDDIDIDINVMRPSFWSENKDTLSQKIRFNSQEFLDSFSNSFLCSIKKSATPDNGLFSNAPLFFSKVYDNIIAKNFLIINSIFYYLSYLPESIIMLVYGLLGIFIWIGLYLLNLGFSVFFHFINIPQLFRTNSEDTKQWESQETISLLRLGKLLLFFFVWVPIGLLSTFVSPMIFTLYGLICPLYASYRINTNNSNQKYGLFDFIKDTFSYKRFFFFVLATLSLIGNGNMYLGSPYIVGIIIAVIFAYIMGLYVNEMPEQGINGFTAGTHLNQAEVKDIDLSNPKLVEICEQIPMIDQKLENAVKKGAYRKVLKTKGGDQGITNVMPQEQQLQEQFGGRKKKISQNNTKKFNIRLV